MTTLLTEMATVMTQGFLEKHMNGIRLEVVVHHQTFLFIVQFILSRWLVTSEMFSDIYDDL